MNRLTGKYTEFEHAMLQYLFICNPFVRSLWCFEAANANGSDIFIFWLAIAAYLADLFSKPELMGIPVSLSNKITQIFNTHYDEFFKNEFYFVMFCLDPHKLEARQVVLYNFTSVAGRISQVWISEIDFQHSNEYRQWDRQHGQANAILQCLYSSQGFS